MTIWFISDTHFSHQNILNFTVNEAGDKLRPGFRDISHMDEIIIQKWNSVVKPSDHVYHLGDVAMKRAVLPIAKRLNGHKRLLFGNHDIFDYQEYAKAGFEKMAAMRVLDGMIFTHLPVHPSQLARFKINVHGHLHNNRVLLENKHPDQRYLNVCVERTDYTPISLEAIKSMTG